MKKKGSFIRIIFLMKKSFFPYILGLLGISFLTLAIQLSQAYMYKDIFNPTFVKDFPTLLSIIKKYGLYILFFLLSKPLFVYITHNSSAVITGKIRKEVFDKIEALPFNFFCQGHSGDLLSRLTNDIAEVEKAYSDYLIAFSTQIVTGIGALVASFILEWRLAIIVLAGGLLSLFINIYSVRILRSISLEVQNGLADLTENLSNLLDGVHIIRSFNIQKIILGKYYKNNLRVYRASCDRVNKRAIIITLSDLAGTISFIGIITVGFYLFHKGMITVGVIIAAVQFYNSVSVLFKSLGNFISELQGSLAAADRIFEVLDKEKEPERFAVSTSEESKNKEVEKTNVIAFRNVSFNYGEERVLDELSFSVPEGKVYALVGPSGGGKSTIFKLLLNFYPPLEGNIYINGKSVGEQYIKDIRSMIAYVPQNAYLFAGSIADNIRYGKEDVTFAEIENAAKMANADDFIINMEAGYDTLVGKRGAHLSGGQRQRIAIARAILKDAPILLLDEATSALDTESEALVQESLDKLMNSRTTLIIAHRLSTIQEADQILVLDKGKIVEKGNHQELINLSNGIYKNLYEQQFIKEEENAS